MSCSRNSKKEDKGENESSKQASVHASSRGFAVDPPECDNSSHSLRYTRELFGRDCRIHVETSSRSQRHKKIRNHCDIDHSKRLSRPTDVQTPKNSGRGTRNSGSHLSSRTRSNIGSIEKKREADRTCSLRTNGPVQRKCTKCQNHCWKLPKSRKGSDLCRTKSSDTNIRKPSQKGPRIESNKRASSFAEHAICNKLPVETIALEKHGGGAGELGNDASLQHQAEGKGSERIVQPPPVICHMNRVEDSSAFMQLHEKINKATSGLDKISTVFPITSREVPKSVCDKPGNGRSRSHCKAYHDSPSESHDVEAGYGVICVKTMSKTSHDATNLSENAVSESADDHPARNSKTHSSDSSKETSIRNHFSLQQTAGDNENQLDEAAPDVVAAGSVCHSTRSNVYIDRGSGLKESEADIDGKVRNSSIASEFDDSKSDSRKRAELSEIDIETVEAKGTEKSGKQDVERVSGVNESTVQRKRSVASGCDLTNTACNSIASKGSIEKGGKHSHSQCSRSGDSLRGNTGVLDLPVDSKMTKGSGQYSTSIKSRKFCGCKKWKKCCTSYSCRKNVNININIK